MSIEMSDSLDRIESGLARVEVELENILENMATKRDFTALIAKADAIIADYWAWAEEVDSRYAQ